MEIVGIPVGLLAPSALAGLAVLLIFMGRLVPRTTYDDAKHEAQEWRTESRIKDQQIAEKDEQLRALGEVGNNVLNVMQALKALDEERNPR